MYVSAFGIAISRQSRTQLFARPHRIHRDRPIDHLPPVRLSGGAVHEARRRF
jgi:hypothetical protein